MTGLGRLVFCECMWGRSITCGPLGWCEVGLGIVDVISTVSIHLMS